MNLSTKNNTKYYIKKTNFWNLYIATICFCTVFLSVGFASFSNYLSIDGISATVRTDVDMRIKSIGLKEISQDVVVSYNEYNVKNTSTGVILPYSDSFAIFDIDIINLGNIEMGISSIFGSVEELKYEIVNNDYISDGYNPYTLKDRLCDDTDQNKCKLGTESHILVKVSYKDIESYNDTSTYFDVNLSYNFKQVYKVEFSEDMQKFLTEIPNTYVTANDDISIGVNLISSNDVKITSTYILTKDIDYSIRNKVLIIKKIQGDILVDISLNYNINEEIGLSVSADFIGNRDVIITINGSNPNDAIFIKILPEEVKITNDSSTLYDPKYVGTGANIYKKGENMYISYEYIDGNVTPGPFGKAFTIKYRDTTTKCNGINAAPELVTNHTKNQFNILETGLSTGNLTKDAVDYISVYADTGYTFDNFKFRIKYGRTSELEDAN